MNPRRALTLASSVVGAVIVAVDGTVLTVALCTGFALLGAGFGTVLVAATHVVVRQAAAGSAGVAGGLQQTAMNVGPALGVAAATTLMGLDHGPGLPLSVLAVVAVAGAMAGRTLPKRSASTINHGQQGDRARIPARP